MIILLITLVLTFTSDGVRITVTTDAPAHHIYIQADNAAPLIRLCDLDTGESCGFTAYAPLASSLRVRVWDGGTNPSAEQTIQIPAPHRVYVPLF